MRLMTDETEWRAPNLELRAFISEDTYSIGSKLVSYVMLFSRKNLEETQKVFAKSKKENSHLQRCNPFLRYAHDGVVSS